MLTPPSDFSSDFPSSSVRRDEKQDHGHVSFGPEFHWQITRQLGSTITFASFDPETATVTNNSTGDIASGAQAFRKLSLNDELCKPKRIVIETTSDGQSTWRFIPNAKREEGVESEGSWPRVVDVDGTFAVLTEDQWNKFKLDRRYDCLVRAPPNLTSITRCESFRRESTTMSPRESGPSAVPARSLFLDDYNSRFKRQLSDDFNDPLPPSSGLSNYKKRRSRFAPYPNPLDSSDSSDDSDEDEDILDEDEVTLMIIDEQGWPKKHLRSERLKKVRARHAEARRKRREYFAKMKEQSRPEEEYDFPQSTEPQPQSDTLNAGSESPAKRKAQFRTSDSIVSDSDSEAEMRYATYAKQCGAKRIRVVSPDTVRRTIEVKRARRAKKKHEELNRRAWNQGLADEEMIAKQLYEEGEKLHAEAKSSSSPSGGTTAATEQFTHDSEPPLDEEAERQAKIKESQRKIAELEKDKPLWEEAAGRRLAQEAQERAEAEEKRRAWQARMEAEEQQRRGEELNGQEERNARQERERAAEIEESRRKIAELEKDKPLWEEAARRRLAQEAQERADAEAKRRAWQARMKAEEQRRRDEEERKRREEENARQERERKAAAEAELRERKRCQARKAALDEARRWGLLPHSWTPRAALKRYVRLSDAFDEMNFTSQENVVLFETIPWPVLKRPGSFAVEDIDWNAVESFFRQVKSLVSRSEYGVLVEKSHKRFHPDRWRSRRVLQSVDDEEEKECLEVAANTVAQALTPLWQQAKAQ